MGRGSHRKHGRESRHIPLGLGGGGTVGLQKGQVAAAEAALLHDATAPVAAAARPAGWSACGWEGWSVPRPAERGLGGPAPGPPSWTEHGHSLRVPRPRVAWEMGSPTFQDRRSRDTSAPLSQTLRQVGMGGGRRRREERSEDLKHRTLLSSRPPLAPPGSKSQPPGKAPSTSVSGPGGGGGGAPSKGSVMGPMGGAGPSTPSGSHSLGEGQQLPDPTVPLPAPKGAGDRGRAQARQAAGARMDGRIRNAFQREAWKPPSLALGGPFLRGVSGGWGAECLRGVPGPGVTGRGGAGLPSPAPPGGAAPPGRGPCTRTPTSNVCFGSHCFPTPFIKSPI